MQRALFFSLLLAFASCRFHHHEQMMPHFSSPAYITNCDSISGELVVEGNYQGKNIYVQNPFASCTDTTIKFCTASVTINDSITLPKDSITSSAFRIPLTDYGLQDGEKVRIVIKHYPDCKPRILGPEVH